MSLNVLKWNYRERTEEDHIGPVAEEFYELFKLGGSDKSISTIDANGVALASIQALKIENGELKMENEKLNEKMDLLEARLEKLEAILSKH